MNKGLMSLWGIAFLCVGLPALLLFISINFWAIVITILVLVPVAVIIGAFTQGDED